MSRMNAVLRYLVLTAKILTFLVLVVVLMALSGSVSGFLHDAGLRGTWLEIADEAMMLIATLLAASLIIRFWDRHRDIMHRLGLSFGWCRRDMLCGTLVAVIIYAAGFAFLLAGGWIAVTGFGVGWGSLAQTFLLMTLVSLAEETMVRGFVLGHLLDAGINRFVALGLSSLLFSSMHLANPNFSLTAFVNIFIAGLLLGSVFIYTRSLAFSVCLHLFWNWIQGPVLGFGVSGLASGGSVLTLSLAPQTLMNGGDFGFEASLPCTVLMLLFLTLILLRHEKNTHPCPVGTASHDDDAAR